MELSGLLHSLCMHACMYMYIIMQKRKASLVPVELDPVHSISINAH